MKHIFGKFCTVLMNFMNSEVETSIQSNTLEHRPTKTKTPKVKPNPRSTELGPISESVSL